MTEDKASENHEDINLLAMQMQKYQHKPSISLTELWTIWSLVDSTCYDINGRDDQGVPPIVYAAKRGSTVLVRLLLNYHADINAFSKIRETAVIAACRKQKYETARYLIDRGARLDICDSSQFSALRWASLHGNVRMVRYLLEHKVSVIQDCYTTNSALEISMAQPTKAHSKITLLLQRQLVVEKRSLLSTIVKKKEQDEIAAIKRHRRKLRKRVVIAAGIGCADSADHGGKNVSRSPFSLPIVPSLKKKHWKHGETQPIQDARGQKFLGNSNKDSASCPQPLVQTSSMHSVLEVPFGPPAMAWKKTGKAMWCPVKPQPGRSTSNESLNEEVVSLIGVIELTALELFNNETKWQLFIARDHGCFKVDSGSSSTWDLEVVE